MLCQKLLFSGSESIRVTGYVETACLLERKRTVSHQEHVATARPRGRKPHNTYVSRFGDRALGVFRQERKTQLEAYK